MQEEGEKCDNASAAQNNPFQHVQKNIFLFTSQYKYFIFQHINRNDVCVLFMSLVCCCVSAVE